MTVVTGMNGIKARTVKSALLLAVMLPLLSGCNGIEAASKSTEQLAYRLNFHQVALIASKSSPGRVLNMHVFTGTSTHIPRASQEVSFHAQLQP